MRTQLINKVALVTGATRGIGKGIALQLGENGAKVYITGRTLKGQLSLEQTENEIKKRGGTCVPVVCDHENDKDIENLFNKIATDEKGQLDILVNSAYKGGKFLFENSGKNFWELDPVQSWDEVNNVGLRNHYICTVYASRLMVPRKQGLIVNITSLGGLQYSFSATYGIGKAAIDRMSVDCGIELRRSNVACLSLLLNGVKTELATDLVKQKGEKVVLKLDPNSKFLSEIKLKDVLPDAESTEFAGRVICAIANDPNLMKLSSKVINAAEYAQKHGIRDIDNRTIASYRQINSAVKLILPKELHFVSNFIPNFVKVPQFVMDLANTKF